MMIRKNLPAAIMMLAVAFLLGGTSTLFGQPFGMSSYTIDGGGGSSANGNFVVQGTIGQPDASQPLTGGSFTVTGGFWTPVQNAILLGDVNGDGEINLLDVAPFVEAITNGDFIAEADINQDGSVDLLDVAPFVELLTGT